MLSFLFPLLRSVAKEKTIFEKKHYLVKYFYSGLFWSVLHSNFLEKNQPKMRSFSKVKEKLQFLCSSYYPNEIIQMIPLNIYFCSNFLLKYIVFVCKMVIREMLFIDGCTSRKSKHIDC